MDNNGYGAPVERGRVIRLIGGAPVVESIDRPGLITGELQTLVAVSQGEAVFYCAFEDGSGLVLAVCTKGAG